MTSEKTMKSRAEELDDEHKKVTHVYAALIASMLMSFIPNIIFAVISVLMVTCVFIATYIIRAKAAENSLVKNHMVYIIRTVWLASFFGIITAAIGFAYAFFFIDNSAMSGCAIENTPQCIETFFADNRQLFKTATAISIVPIGLYFAYRMANGLSRAIKGYRISNPKAWF